MGPPGLGGKYFTVRHHRVSNNFTPAHPFAWLVAGLGFFLLIVLSLEASDRTLSGQCHRRRHARCKVMIEPATWAELPRPFCGSVGGIFFQ